MYSLIRFATWQTLAACHRLSAVALRLLIDPRRASSATSSPTLFRYLKRPQRSSPQKKRAAARDDGSGDGHYLVLRTSGIMHKSRHQWRNFTRTLSHFQRCDDAFELWRGLIDG